MLLHQKILKRQNIKWLLSLCCMVFSCSHRDEKNFSKSDSQQRVLNIPKNMVYISRVLVKKATLRKSPSLDSPITDYVLKRHEKLIVHGRYQEWVKVFSLSQKKKAWIHQAMISEPIKNRKSYMIPEKGLQKTRTTQTIYQAWSFRSLDEISTKVEKGTHVYILMNKKNKALSWIPKEKKVLWLPQKTLDL
ncbi:MAG: SH3 domain-containing protein [Oligoflexales bacterium]